MVLGFGRHAIAASELADLHPTIGGRVFGNQLIYEMPNMMTYLGFLFLRICTTVSQGFRGAISSLPSLSRDLVLQNSGDLVDGHRFIGGVDDSFKFCFKAHWL